MIISIVVAAAENNAIGKNNQLLWRLPADLKHFKEITTNHTVIMGRKTYDSIGKPLPNRRNIVITRATGLQIDGTTVVNSLQNALDICEPGEEVFIIGGAEIYRQALPFTNKIYLTRVHRNYEGDAFFPEIEPDSWKETDIKRHEPDEKNPVAYTFITLLNK